MSTCAKAEPLWINLSIREQAAASILGWDINKWEDGETPTIGYKKWEELNEIEKAAAIGLGYMQYEWNLEVLSACQRRDYNKERLNVRSIWLNSSDAQKLPQAINDFKRLHKNISNSSSEIDPPSINRQIGQFDLANKTSHISSVSFGNLDKVRQSESSSVIQSLKPLSPVSLEGSLEHGNLQAERASSF